MKNFCKDLQKHGVKIINYEKKKKKKKTLIKEIKEMKEINCIASKKFVIYAKKNLVRMTMTLHSKNTISTRSLSLH